MKKSFWYLGFAILSMCLASCSSVAPVPPGPNPYPRSQPIFSQQPAPSENRDILLVKVITLADEDGRDFAVRVDRGVSGGFLGTPEVKVVESGNSDFLLSIRPSLLLFDKTGENYIYEAEASVMLKDASQSRVYASQELSWKGSREFGQEKALRKMVATVVTDVTAWSENALKTVAVQDYAATIVTVQLPKSFWERIRGRNSVEDRNRVLEASKEIGRLPGVMNYELQELDLDNGMARFRVVYVRRQYPVGLVNVVSKVLMESEALNY